LPLRRIGIAMLLTAAALAFNAIPGAARSMS
jgi:hypothetical protein